MEPPRRIPDILFGSLIDYVVLASYQICVLDAKLLLYEMTMQIVNQNEYVHTRSRKPLLLRLRGGMDNPNVDDKSSEIPYLSHQKFMWTGFPCTDFQEKVMYPMENGLASMTVKGYSLLDACNQTDAGGIFGVRIWSTSTRCCTCRCGRRERTSQPQSVFVSYELYFKRFMVLYECKYFATA